MSEFDLHKTVVRLAARVVDLDDAVWRVRDLLDDLEGQGFSEVPVEAVRRALRGEKALPDWHRNLECGRCGAEYRAGHIC